MNTWHNDRVRSATAAALGTPLLGSNTPGLIAGGLVLVVLLAALFTGGVVVAIGAVLCAFLVGLTYFYPERMLLVTLGVSILVSIDISVKQDPFPRVGPTRVLLAALYIGTLLNWWLKRNPDRISLRELPLLRPILLYAAAVLASAFMSIVPMQSYFAAFTDIVEQFFLFYLFVNYLRQPGFWKRIEKVIFVTTALVCVFAVLEEISQFNPLAGFFEVIDDDLYRGGLLRVRATFYHPIALGCFLALVFPFVLSALIREPSRRKKIALAALLAAMFVTSFLTVSRGPWIAILIEFGMFVTWWAWRNLWRVAVLAVSLAFALSAFTFLRTNDAFERKVAPILNPNQISLKRTNEASSEYYRIALLNAVTDRLEGSRWIYGFGRGSFYLADVESNYDNNKHVLEAGDSHYILLLLEIGVAGLAACLFMLLAAINACFWTTVRSQGSQQLLALACLAAVTGFVWNNATVSMFPVLPLNLIFWSAVALSSTISHNYFNSISRSSSPASTH
jgi:O-antigen ligase